jgi:hypothetical protein
LDILDNDTTDDSCPKEGLHDVRKPLVRWNAADSTPELPAQQFRPILGPTFAAFVPDVSFSPSLVTTFQSNAASSFASFGVEYIPSGIYVEQPVSRDLHY